VTLRKRKIMREMRYKNRTYKLKKRGKVHLKKREKNIQNIKKKLATYSPHLHFSPLASWLHLFLPLTNQLRQPLSLI
jgi:hypothetical protein